MTIQLQEATRNGRLTVISANVAVGANSTQGGRFTIRTGAQPATTATANSGTEVVTFQMGSTGTPAFAAAAAGAMAKQGTWQGVATGAMSADGHFRVYELTGATCILQGNVRASAGDLILDNINIAVDQQVTVTTFTLTSGNA